VLNFPKDHPCFLNAVSKQR